MPQPLPHYLSLQDALRALTSSAAAPTLTPVQGGNVNQSFQATLANRVFFVKRNQRDFLANFAYEAASLRLLASSQFTMAEPLALVQDDSYSYLIIKWIDSAPRAPDFWSNFAAKLSDLHLNFTQPQYGWEASTGAHWASYFRDKKLLMRIEQCWAYFSSRDKHAADNLLKKTENILLEPPRPQLLHGDLWHANVLTDARGEALLIDPQAYYGHGEFDLAVAKLWGEFDDHFFQTYRELNPWEPELEARIAIYQLEQLLMNLHLFGAEYLADCEKILHHFG